MGPAGMSPGEIYLMELVQKQCESEASETSDLFFLILKAINPAKSQQACFSMHGVHLFINTDKDKSVKMNTNILGYHH